MTGPVHGPALPDPPYKSTWREIADPSEGGRDRRGRFVPHFSGPVCDRFGCLDGVEGPGRRFCADHRAEHGQRLLDQLHAIIGSDR